MTENLGFIPLLITFSRSLDIDGSKNIGKYEEGELRSLEGFIKGSILASFLLCGILLCTQEWLKILV